jgi:hypothetical protein
MEWAGLHWGRTVTHSTRSPILRCGHLVQRPQLKHSPHRFKPMQRTTGTIGHYAKLIGKCGSYLGITCRHVP